MSGYKQPLPKITIETKPFWSATKNHELRIPRCKECGGYFLPPSGMCPNCLSNDIQWPRVSGNGRVVSWAVFHKPSNSGWAPAAPYVVVEVELDEGPRLATQLVNTMNRDIEADARVEVTFEDVTDQISLLKFRLSKK